MNSEMNCRVALRTVVGVAGAASPSPLPSAGNEDYRAVSRALSTMINMQPAGGNTITGDPRIYGRVYFGTNGRGVIYGDPS
ncbi:MULTISPECIES: hypothetical protein [unclassified Streptomyces]|uniref:hypothetical protein n=1 Tax=unclassified Streptomyces TaxID=2593676 RepID=UPI00117EF8F0|nr:MULTISPECIES: hypothetical protein [unclassified Streptomyces]